MLVGTPIIVGDVNDSIRDLLLGSKIGPVVASSLPEIFERSNEILDNSELFREKVLEKRAELIQNYHVTRVARELEDSLFEQRN